MYVWSDILSPYDLRVVEPTKDHLMMNPHVICVPWYSVLTCIMVCIWMRYACIHRGVSGGLACECEGRWSTLMPPALSGV